MEKEPSTEQRIDEILESFNGMQRAETHPFFYTRLQAKLEYRVNKKNSWDWAGKPVFSFATLLLLLVLNIIAVSAYLNTKKVATQTLTDIENFAKEYSLDESSVYTDKPEP
jgi:hypothetical protein